MSQSLIVSRVKRLGFISVWRGRFDAHSYPGAGIRLSSATSLDEPQFVREGCAPGCTNGPTSRTLWTNKVSCHDRLRRAASKRLVV